MISNYGEKFDPMVFGVIDPIIDACTNIDLAQRTNPALKDQNEPDAVKEMKKRCVHIIKENGEFRRAAEKKDGKLICRVCGREINTSFTEEDTVKVLQNAISVINQLLFFGLFKGLSAGPVKTLIDIKAVLPGVISRCEELNKFVTAENKSAETAANIGGEYAINNMRSITSYGAPY